MAAASFDREPGLVETGERPQPEGHPGAVGPNGPSKPDRILALTGLEGAGQLPAKVGGTAGTKVLVLKGRELFILEKRRFWQ
ncbi:hypothetical protein SAMN05660235_00637 [Sporolituus thermophilus DSM 23256]|uniref:Uncharacterized protein n=1 Tax=Sporolituus thermophilus DSM 23256 TaxID=1123285 RepID=A0A1G7ITI6_9FIRM|nr:hypothetical protein SAMN05660235_00637 [Sporolituus thermophilus DSM 23256]